MCLQSISLVLRHPVTKYKWMFSLKHTLPLVLACHTHAQSPSLALSLSLQDYDMLLIAAIISDSLPKNRALLWGREAQRCSIQKSAGREIRKRRRREKKGTLKE